MTQWSPNPEENPEESRAAKRRAAKAQAPAVPPVLQNWQVLDGELHNGPVVDGEATIIDTETLLDAEPPSTPSIQVADHQDPALIATLAERHLQVQPGEEVTYTLTLLNNGPTAGYFTLTAEGWIDERWLLTPPPTVKLEPGERQSVTVTLQPTRTTKTQAGTRTLVFCLRADCYPERVTRLGATLTVAAYRDLRLGRVEPAEAALSWQQPTTTFTLPITNRGNSAVTVRLSAHDREEQCAFGVTLPGSKASLPQQVKLQPGQSVIATVQARLHHYPRWRSRPLTVPIHLRVAADGSAAQLAQATLTARPLIGLWQLTSVLGIGALLVAAIGVAGLSALLMVAISFAQPSPAPSPVQAAPQSMIILIQSPIPEQPQPVADNQTVAAPQAVSAASGASSVVQVGQDARDLSAPLVSAEQVSGPGTAPANVPITGSLRTTALAAAPAPISAAPAPTAAPMTYGTMFQEIALRYDLNWRVLAAQAYVESGFDSLALGQHGDLGLMQIQPRTWREWAPKVKASDPFDSYSNVLVAAIYSDYLRTTLSKRGFTEPQWTLIAYNWGIDKVLQHLNSGKGWNDLEPARQEYATEVMRLAETIQTN